MDGPYVNFQVSQLKKETDDLKVKLNDYEKMNKFQKAVSSDESAISSLESKLDTAKKQLSTTERDHKSEVNTIKMKHDSKVALMTEEINALKAQSAKYGILTQIAHRLFGEMTVLTGRIHETPFVEKDQVIGTIFTNQHVTDRWIHETP